ncbi:MAG: glycosyltransferase, partial [Alphaproteobacteria bacterium]
VEDFARRLAREAGAATHVLDRDTAALSKALNQNRALVLNLPVVAWKKKLVEPFLAMLTAARAGAERLVILHEWADLDWKRRLTYGPILPLASAVMFSSPEVARQFAASPLSRVTTRRRGLVPIPMNVSRPALTNVSRHSDRIAAERARGRQIVAHFGSIYPKKQSTVVLDVARSMIDQGGDPFVLFIGSFVKGMDRVEEAFQERLTALGLEDRVLVTGYVADNEELFGLFDQADLFVYAFADGLTSRRGSVLAAAMSGKPVIVNAPAHGDAFDHHPTYRGLIERGDLILVPLQATTEVIAKTALEAATRGVSRTPPRENEAWADARRAVETCLAG